MRQWNIAVIRGEQSIHIGQVTEPTLEQAYHQAIVRFSIPEDYIDIGEVRLRKAQIYPNENLLITEQ